MQTKPRFGGVFFCRNNAGPMPYDILIVATLRGLTASRALQCSR
jgi:hypothetical protein